MKLRECENFVVLGLFLGAVGLFSALVLGVVSNLTEPAIKEAERKDREKALKQLIPDFDKVKKERVIDGVTFRAVCDKAGKLVGIAAEAETKNGYAGTIKELVGFEPDGTIIAVLITEDHETPGLGKVVCERKNQKTIKNLFDPPKKGLPPNEILLDKFSGRKVGDGTKWRLKKDGGDFDGKTGATVTSRAVTEMTGKTVETFAKHRSKILKEFGETAPEVKK